MKKSIVLLPMLLLSSLLAPLFAATHNGDIVDMSLYANRETLPDFTSQCEVDHPMALIQIKDNLYRHETGAGLAVHTGMVLITKEGAVVIDPAMTCSAIWLNDKINTEFKVPVKYVIYTHAHADHIMGSQVFSELGAEIIANQRAIEPIVGEKLLAPVPTISFDKAMTLTIDDIDINLTHIAPSHSDSMTVVTIPSYRAMQCTDICQSKTMPYNDFLDFYYTGWIQTLDWVIAQDVDYIDVGHYWPATKQDQVNLRNYLVDLHQQVLDLVRSGHSWDELYRKVVFNEEVQSWTGFASMKTLNTYGMYRWVTNHRRGNW